MPIHWYQQNSGAVLQQLGTEAAQGLSRAEVNYRLVEYGPNELSEKRTESPWHILGEQLTDTMVVILIVAAVLSLLLGDYTDAIAILAIVVFNAFLGFKQNYQAQQAIAALQKLAVPTVKVCRDRTVVEISATQLVPGDILLLEAGNSVPADARLIESANLRIQEASLTGESEPAEKISQALGQEDLALGDRQNMVYMGTAVTYGRGVAVVTETGMRSELGQIATAIQTAVREPTRLQKRLDELGRSLAIVILILVATIFGLGLLRGENLQVMFLTAVSLGVAIVPEGLATVVTIALALGAQQMLKRNALIRQLPAVETLGSVTVICSDKTGTLTENHMTVTFLGVAGQKIKLTEPLHDRHPKLNNSLDSSIEGKPAMILLLSGAVLCNDAWLESHPDRPQQIHAIGDPTEGALVEIATRLGFGKAALEQGFPRIDEIPFESDRKRMTTVHEIRFDQLNDSGARSLAKAVWGFPEFQQLSGTAGSAYIAFSKGTVEGLLGISSRVWGEGGTEVISDAWRDRILTSSNQLAQEGMRVLGIAFRPLSSRPKKISPNTIEQELIFVGVVGMIDPARADVKAAVQTCRTAGIRPVMITGDHPLTAQHIAHELGIATDDRILTGQDLDGLSNEALRSLTEEISVYARVSPQHKLDIVQAFQQQGNIVAMTGDGVNDAPALKKADIGVAMGITGTDVAKDAADMVLLDDNFSTIVAATKEGRVIYDNIRKFIKYIMTGNVGELWVIILAPFLGMPLPLVPLQILWINLLADGILALALSVEPAERHIMHRPPYRPDESLFSRGVGRDIGWIGLLLGLLLLGVAYRYWAMGYANWQTMVFSTLAFSRMGMAQAIRSERDSLFRIGLMSNKAALGATILTFCLQIAVIYVPFLQDVFQTSALSGIDLGLCLGLSTVVFWSMEIEKWLIRRKGIANK